MSECKQITELFGELLDDEVDHKIDDNVRHHLCHCTECREDFKWYGITIQALRGLEPVSPPRDFVLRLNARLYATPSSRFREFFKSVLSSSPYMPLPVGVSTLALIFVIGFVFYNHGPSEIASYVSPTAGMDVSGSVGRMAAERRTATRPATAAQSSQAPPKTSVALIPKSLPFPVETDADAGVLAPTVADKLGADNLTVESRSIDQAVESVKRILPNIQGKLVDEKTPGNIGEKVLAVIIPTDSYGNLATELVNHGAVAVGLGSNVGLYAPIRKDGNNVLLYIRFTNSR